MIGAALRFEIEMYVRERRSTNLIFKGAEEGTLTVAMITRYLAAIGNVLREGQRNLALARDRSLALGDPALAAFYAKKCHEEAGHDEWAGDDLERLASSRRLIDNNSMDSIERILDFQAELVDEHPRLFLAYVFFGECLTVLGGPEWLTLLEERCGIPRSAMSVVANHILADEEHVDEMLEEIDRLVADPALVGRMRAIVQRACDYYDAFCKEVVSHEEYESAHVRRGSAA